MAKAVVKEKEVAEKKAAVKKSGIPPLNSQIAAFEIRGTAPYVQHKFSQKVKAKMMEKHREGSKVAGKKTAKEPRDFEADFKAATYRGPKGETGIPAPAFRSAMIDVCRAVGFKMTVAKQAIFVEPDVFDPDEMTPLVLIKGKKGEPTMMVTPLPNDNGATDLRARPKWEPGWTAKVRIKYDGDIFTKEEVRALLERAGVQCGIGEGRPYSRQSFGCGWGTFEIVDK